MNPMTNTTCINKHNIDLHKMHFEHPLVDYNPLSSNVLLQLSV